MECINKVELAGLVGCSSVTPVQDKQHVNMSVATDYAYRDKDGNTVLETTWHRVSGFLEPGATAPQKGDAVHICGRIRQIRYVNADGNDVVTTDIVASKIEIIIK